MTSGWPNWQDICSQGSDPHSWQWQDYGWACYPWQKKPHLDQKKKDRSHTRRMSIVQQNVERAPDSSPERRKLVSLFLEFRPLAFTHDVVIPEGTGKRVLLICWCVTQRGQRPPTIAWDKSKVHFAHCTQKVQIWYVLHSFTICETSQINLFSGPPTPHNHQIKF